jgi:hypothetical protein
MNINEVRKKECTIPAISFEAEVLTLSIVLIWLAKFTMSGAEFNSSARDPPPRCHPTTRLAILARILSWLSNFDREHQLLWINGSAGIGKSAIMQTLAEALVPSDKLGATLFFSRPNNRNNASLVFPTLAYQLAVKLPLYYQYLERKLTDDPKLLETSIATQFEILITEPFSSMSERTIGSFAIIVDGLDECECDRVQIQIFKLISQFSHHHPHSPLLWCIASRPEAHLTHAFASPEVSCTFQVEEVPLDSTEACKQVERFLRARFAEIHERYSDVIPANSTWPPECDFTKICSKSSGHFGFASTVADFIDDPHVGDPIAQLNVVLSVTASSQATDALAALHLLYARILDAVPKGLLPTMKLLLAHPLFGEDPAVVFNSRPIPLVHTATLFDLPQHTVYAALRKLHSVISVPSPKAAGLRSIRFHHASFGDYLHNSLNSGEYAIDPVAFRTELWLAYSRFTHVFSLSSFSVLPLSFFF